MTDVQDDLILEGFEDHFRARLGKLGEKLPATHRELNPRAFLDVGRRLSVVRSAWYSLRFRGPFLVARGTRVVMHRSARVEFGPRSFLLLGFHHHGPNPVLLNMGRNARLVIRGTVQVWRGTQLIVVKGGRLTFGDKCIFNEGARIVCHREVTFGDESGMSWDATLMDSDQHPIAVDGQWLQASAPVTVGNHVMVAAGAMVMKGVTIGDGSIVAAGAVVTRDVPPRSVVAGNPARVIRENVDWH